MLSWLLIGEVKRIRSRIWSQTLKLAVRNPCQTQCEHCYLDTSSWPGLSVSSVTWYILISRDDVVPRAVWFALLRELLHRQATLPSHTTVRCPVTVAVCLRTKQA